MAAKTLRPSRTTHRDAVDRGSPRDRLRASANELFYADGVQTVGIDRVIEHAGVAKGSLYNLFGSKEGLVRAYLESRYVDTMKRIMAAVERHRSPRRRLLAVFEAQGELFAEPDFRGCAFVVATAEAPRGGLVEQAAGEYRTSIRVLFTDLAEQVGVSDPRTLARQLQVVYDGAGLVAGMDRDPSIATSARAAAEALLDASL